MSDEEQAKSLDPATPHANLDEGIEAGELTSAAADTGDVPLEPTNYPKWMSWGFIIGITLAFIACAGVGNWGMHAVMDSDANRWIQQYKDDESITEVLGGIERGGYDLPATFREQNEETVVYFINGPKGSGHLVITEFGMKVPRVEFRSGGKSWVLSDGVVDPNAKEHE